MSDTLTAQHAGHLHVMGSVAAQSERRAHEGVAAKAAWLVVAVVALAAGCQLRWSLVISLPWQCDELPVLMRNTGVAGYAANEIEARKFTPSRYTAYKGALRSLRSRGTIAQHVTTNFWTNLTVHVFGCTPAAGRAAPFFWSIVAVFAVAWAAWLITHRLTAACLAGWIVALSPHAIAYGAQARGYAEALALTPLLIILIELLRRRPERKLLGIAVFVCALQLSLTFYTMWIYWVFPAVVIMVLALPRTIGVPNDRRTYAAAAMAIAVGLCAAMTIFTIDRWDKLTFVASYVASNIEPGPGLFDRLAIFFSRTAERLLSFSTAIMLVALVGIPVLWRSHLRWWFLTMAAGVIVPVLFALANGTPGYTRTFGFLIAPIAILFGLGADVVVRSMHARLRLRYATAMAAVFLLASTTWAYPGVQRRARAILLPDWGELVLAFNKEPQSAGPRWFCHCLANYWQINWYQAPSDYEAMLTAPAGSTIEVVLGAQLDDAGRPTVYQLNPPDGTIRAAALPEFLAAVPPTDIKSGIEVRRWIGTKLDFRNPGRPEEPSLERRPIFVLIAVEEPFTLVQWQRLLERTNGVAEGVVTFKTSLHGTQVVESLIAPADLLQSITHALDEELRIDAKDVHLYSLLTSAK